MDGSVKSKALGHLETEDKLNLFEKSAQKFSKTEIKVSLLSTVSLLALTSCGGGGGGIFGAFGAGGGALLGGMLLKGPISGARVFQDLNLNNVYDPGEPFAFTQPDGSYSLQTLNDTAPILTDGGVDTTTGANAGSFKFNPAENITTVTPVSVVITQINDDIDPNTAFTKFSSLSAPVSFDNYNPIQSAADAGGTNVDAAIVDAVGAQMQTTINGLSTLLAEIASITSTDPYQTQLMQLLLK